MSHTSKIHLYGHARTSRGGNTYHITKCGQYIDSHHVHVGEESNCLTCLKMKATEVRQAEIKDLIQKAQNSNCPTCIELAKLLAK